MVTTPFAPVPKTTKSQEKKISFVEDQRKKIGLLGGLMTMGDMDKKETKFDKEKAEKEEKKTKKAKKRASEAFRVEKAVKRMKEPDPELISEDVDYNLLDQEIDEDYELDEKVAENKRNLTTIDIESYVAEIDRYRDSDREASAKFNAVIRCLEKLAV